MPVADGLHSAVDFIGARHEDQRITVKSPVEFFGGNVPDRHVADGAGKIFNINRESAPLGFEDAAGRQVFLHDGDIECGRHDNNQEIRPTGLLDLQGPCESDVAVQMAFVKFVKEDGADAGQFRVSQHLPEQDAFGDIPDAGAG